MINFCKIIGALGNDKRNKCTEMWKTHEENTKDPQRKLLLKHAI